MDFYTANMICCRPPNPGEDLGHFHSATALWAGGAPLIRVVAVAVVGSVLVAVAVAPLPRFAPTSDGEEDNESTKKGTAAMLCPRLGGYNTSP